jgi:putative transcriptional regulator
VPLKDKKPLKSTALDPYDANRDLASELPYIRQLDAPESAVAGHHGKAGQVHVVRSAATEARRKTGLSQSHFAKLNGVSVRTLQGWEQGRKEPSRAARTPLAIASTNP